MSAFRSQQLPCRRIASFGRYTLTGFDPGRRVPPLPLALTSPSSSPPLPLSRLTLTDGRMVRAAWHTSMAHHRAVMVWLVGLHWLHGAVRCTDLGAFLLQGPAIYLISAHPEPTLRPFHFRTPSLNSSPVSSGPGRNRPHIDRLLGLPRQGRRRVHDVSFCGYL